MSKWLVRVFIVTANDQIRAATPCGEIQVLKESEGTEILPLRPKPDVNGTLIKDIYNINIAHGGCIKKQWPFAFVHLHLLLLPPSPLCPQDEVHLSHTGAMDYPATLIQHYVENSEEPAAC